MRIFCLLFIVFLFTISTTATIRYVSKSGSSTPPFTSWETASDSIQKCINICVDGDTVIVANGVYKESLIINPAISLIGSSMDSCIIDGRGLVPFTVNVKNNFVMSGFRVYGQKYDTNNAAIIMLYNSLDINMNISSCKISDCSYGINTGKSSGLLNNLIIFKALTGIGTWCASDTCKPKLTNSLIIVENEFITDAFYSSTGGRPILLNNILLSRIENGQTSNSWGIVSDTEFSKIIKNNLFGGFLSFISTGSSNDSTIVHNNVLTGQNYSDYGVFYSVRRSLFAKNNVISNNRKVFYSITSQPKLDYNIYWNNEKLLPTPYQLGLHDIHADPMFVKDTLVSSQKGDYHLQMYSPGIDAGDPAILDKDGSRSDIGMYGGPGGEAYQYLDLPPLTPRNIKYTADINEKKIIFSWKKNSESDFKEYQVFRDTVQGFTPDSCSLYISLPDSLLSDTASFTDTYTGESVKYYYRIKAIDNQGNESEASDEISVVITGVDIIDVEIATDYRLYQNYPNPFNPETRIGYQIKESGRVKIMVYDIKGELIEYLLNEHKEKGYYEVSFNAGKYSSGIYLYRIEVIDDSGIPRFMDMKKMLLVK